MPQKTFMAAYKPIVRDIAGNNMSLSTAQDFLAIPLLDRGYRYDVTRPAVSGFVLDLDRAILRFNCSETVSTYKLNVSNLCLQATGNWSHQANAT